MLEPLTCSPVAGEVKDLMQRMEQGQMFTNMAARRIQELGSELASVGVWSVGT